MSILSRQDVSAYCEGHLNANVGWMTPLFCILPLPICCQLVSSFSCRPSCPCLTRCPLIPPLSGFATGVKYCFHLVAPRQEKCKWVVFFIGPKSDHCLALSLSQLLLLNFALIVGFVKVIAWISISCFIGFVKIDTRISLTYYIVLSKLIHEYL